MLAILPLRGWDSAGNGAYGASRGSGRTHKGIDFECFPGQAIYSPFSGVVSKVGISHHDMKYVEIDPATDDLFLRFHYIDPRVQIGDEVGGFKATLGLAQDVTKTYKQDNGDEKPHIHFEIWKGHKDYGGKRINPEPILKRSGIPLL